MNTKCPAPLRVLAGIALSIPLSALAVYDTTHPDGESCGYSRQDVNHSSNYITGVVDGTPAAMHWSSGLVWQRCLVGAGWDGQKCTGLPTIDMWGSRFDGWMGIYRGNDPINGLWRMAPASDLKKLRTGCQGVMAFNAQIFPENWVMFLTWTSTVDDGLGGTGHPLTMDTRWKNESDPLEAKTVLKPFPAKSNDFPTRLVRGGFPFAPISAPAPATAMAGVAYTFAPIVLQSTNASVPWGGARIYNGTFQVNGTGGWVQQAIVTQGDSLAVRLPAASAGESHSATLELRSAFPAGLFTDASGDPTIDTIEFKATAAPLVPADICHVAPDGDANQDGSSWAQATSLAAAMSPDRACTEVRILQGTYTTSAPANALTSSSSKRLLGGYTADGQRSDDPTLTVIDGQGKQRPLWMVNLGNSPADNDTLVEGLTIANGYAKELTLLVTFPGFGGGFSCMCDDRATCRPHFRNVVFRDNRAEEHGGAVSHEGQCQATYENVSFTSNQAGHSGGAVANISTRVQRPSAPVFTRVTFNGNTSVHDGGAVFNWAFNDNSTGTAGPGATRPTFTNVTFSGNRAGRSGGIIHSEIRSGGVSETTLAHVTAMGNTQAAGHAAIAYARDSQWADPLPTTSATRSVFWNNGTEFSTSTPSGVQLGDSWASDCMNATCDAATQGRSGNPLLGPLQDNGGPTPTHLPAANSPVRGQGTTACSPSMDQRGEPRPPTACDLGAVQRLGDTRTLTVNVVTGSGSISAIGGGISNCTATGGVCSASYDSAGVTSRLQATAQPGWRFGTWSGAGCTASGTECSVDMAQSRSIEATFIPNTHAITVNPGPGGTLSCPTPVNHGQAVHCTTTPDNGYTTTSISGCGGTPTGQGVNAYTTGPITGACTVSATFQQKTYSIGGRVNHLTGAGLKLQNLGGDDLHVNTSAFTFATPVAHGGHYGVSIAVQPAGQHCTIANASGSQVTAAVNNVQVDCTPHFEGTTLPTNGPSGTGSASFTGGGPTCRFDLAQTRFEAAPALPPPGQELPQGMFRFKLVGCTPGSAVRMAVSWPAPVHGYLKHGRDSPTATQDRYYAFVPEHQLAISGHTVHFTVKDGALGDDDWSENGEIADPAGPTAQGAMPAGPHAIPTLSQGGLWLLSALAALVGLRRLGNKKN